MWSIGTGIGTSEIYSGEIDKAEIAEACSRKNFVKIESAAIIAQWEQQMCTTMSRFICCINIQSCRARCSV